MQFTPKSELHLFFAPMTFFSKNTHKSTNAIIYSYEEYKKVTLKK